VCVQYRKPVLCLLFKSLNVNCEGIEIGVGAVLWKYLLTQVDSPEVFTMPDIVQFMQNEGVYGREY